MPSIETSSTNNSSVTPESSSMPRSSAISALRDAVSAWDLSARVSCCMEILLRWGCDGTRARLYRWSLMLGTVWGGAEPVTMLPAVIAPSGWTGTRARGTLAARAGRPQARRYGLRPGRCGLVGSLRANLSWRLWPGPAGRGATRSIGQVTSPAGPGRMRSLSGGIGARGFRIGALLLSLATRVLPLIGTACRRSGPTGQPPTQRAEPGLDQLCRTGLPSGSGLPPVATDNELKKRYTPNAANSSTAQPPAF